MSVNGDAPAGEGRYAVYWMQASVSTRDNYALEYAAQLADDVELALLAGFGLDGDYADATPRTRGKRSSTGRIRHGTPTGWRST